MRRFALVLAVAVLTGCGADSPTAPTSQIPEVAGTYTGPLTLRAVTTGDSLQGFARFNVAQAGAQLTITGSTTFLGETAQLPAITGTINATGFFTPTSGGVAGAVNDPDCGRDHHNERQHHVLRAHDALGGDRFHGLLRQLRAVRDAEPMMSAAETSPGGGNPEPRPSAALGRCAAAATEAGSPLNQAGEATRCRTRRCRACAMSSGFPRR